jgi:hypothetical protein
MVHAQTGYHIAFARVSPSFRWYGPELHFERMELRSKDDRRGAGAPDGSRLAADIWQLISSGKLLAGRIELNSPNILIAPRPDQLCVASRSNWAATITSLEPSWMIYPPESWRFARDGDHGGWNSALPLLTLQDVNLDVRARRRRLTLVLNRPFARGTRREPEDRRQCARPRRRP